MGWTVWRSHSRGARFSTPTHTGPGTHSVSYTVCTGLFPGVKRPEHGVNHPPHLALMLSKEKYFISTAPLCLHWGTVTFISDQYVVSVLKCQQVTALKLTNNKRNGTEIHYWLLLLYSIMHVTKIIIEYHKSANLSTGSAPLHWPEAKIHEPSLTVHLSVALSLSQSQ